MRSTCNEVYHYMLVKEKFNVVYHFMATKRIKLSWLSNLWFYFSRILGVLARKHCQVPAKGTRVYFYWSQCFINTRNIAQRVHIQRKI